MSLNSRHAHRHDPRQSKLIDTLVHYHNDGGYLADLTTVGADAIAYLSALDLSKTQKPALVLDVDETSLHNDWRTLVSPANTYDPQAWDAWVQEACAPPVEITLCLYRLALRRGLSVFFITGRADNEREATIVNLKRAGFERFEQLVCEPDAQQRGVAVLFPEASTYKSTTRWSIQDRGYQIVLNVGDQISDVTGGFAQQTFQLPNPFYTVI